MKTGYAGLLGLALTSALALPATSADWYRSPDAPGGYKDAPYAAVTWAGPYVGVNAGGGWGESSDQLANTNPYGGLQPSGGFGGLQVGYNWQKFGYAPLVLGLEADIQGASLDGEGQDGAGGSYRSRLEVFGTVRGRAGYAIDRSLFYLTGGLAYGSVKNEAVALGGDFVANTTSVGYVLGAGVEYRFSPSFSIKGEYQYLNFGTNTPVDISGNGLGTYGSNGGSVRDDAYHTVRLGLNYHPFQGYESLK
jgi:outer membrane immunogenic protein